MAQERNRLTDLEVKNCKPPASGQRDVFDSKLAGFGLRVSAGGTKSFIVLYRLNGRKVRMTLGRYPSLSLADARELADDALRLAARGIDPVRERNLARTPTDGTGSAPQHDAHASKHLTLKTALEEYIEKYAREHNRDWYTKQSVMRREFAGRWPTQSLDSITRDMVMKAIDEIVVATSSSTAHTRFAYLQHFFGWCIGRGYIDTSPIERLRSPAKGASRERVLADGEIVSIVRAARDIGYPYGHVIEALLLSAQRRDEVASMHWSELDLDHATWSLPAIRTKTAKAHLVPLPKRLHGLLGAIPRTHATFVFPARGKDAAVSGFSKWKVELDRLSGVRDWRVHDLRRTAATGMARLRVPPHIIERVLNHATGSNRGMAAIYNRFEYIDEKRDALERWAAHLDSLIQNSPD